MRAERKHLEGADLETGWTPRQKAWFTACGRRRYAVRMLYVDRVRQIGDIRARQLMAEGFFNRQVATVEEFYAGYCAEYGLDGQLPTSEEMQNLEERRGNYRGVKV